MFLYKKDFQRGNTLKVLKNLISRTHRASRAAVLTMRAIATRQCSTPFRYNNCITNKIGCQGIEIRFVYLHNSDFQNSGKCTNSEAFVYILDIFRLFPLFFMPSLDIFIAENNAENRDKCCDNKHYYSEDEIALGNAVTKDG